VPRPPSHPIKPWLSPDFYFAVLDVQQIIQPTGYHFVVTTDVPCRLYMRWSTHPPDYHNVPRFLRGLFVHSDIYICFTVYHDNEQEEAGETTTHTFIKIGWPSCETRWFYFWGTKGVHVMNSTSCVFEKHFLAPEPPPTRNYYATWHNRSVSSLHGTWLTARNGWEHSLSCNYQRPTDTLHVISTLVAMYNICRVWLNVHTFYIPIGATITAARLGLYVTSITGITGSLILTKGLAREPIDENDWAIQTNEVTDLGSIAQSDLVLNQYNWIPLNATGIAWVNQSLLELKQGESSDCERTMGYAVFAPNRYSQTRYPQSDATITTLKLRLRRRGYPGMFYVDIHAADVNHKPTGPTLASGSINGNALTTVKWGLWYEIDLGAGFTPTAGQEYCTVGYLLGGSGTKYIDWRGSPAGMYVNGHLWFSGDNGATWIENPTTDLSNIDYEVVEVGGTNFCIRTGFDVSNLAPTTLQNQIAIFHSAQKGDGFLPILELTLA